MRKTRHKVAMIVLLLMLVLYIIALLKITIFRGSYADVRTVNLIPFATILAYIKSISEGQIILGLINLLGNFVLFIPLGCITALLFPKMRMQARILILSLVFSLVIEITQYLFACGRTDIDDLILNTLGGLVGYWIYTLILKRIESKKYSIKKYLVAIPVLAIMLICMELYSHNHYQFQLIPQDIHVPLAQHVQVEENKITFSNVDINSTHAFLVQLDKHNKKGNKVLFDREGDERIYPASLTKIMTAIVALENLEAMDTNITLSENAFADLYESNASLAGFLPNEEVCADDLLYGLMLPSGAECAAGLAEYVSGSENEFVNLMNKKAQQLGMNDTHFVNATGLHDSNHYSTASDLSTLVAYAIQNDTFYDIFTSKGHTSRPTNLHADGITFYSTMFSKMESDELEDGKILGGKTGYTSEAGQCLASLAEKYDEQFILVTCGAQGDINTQELHIDDAHTVYAALSKSCTD